MPLWLRKYLLPGLIFQSIVIAGGYGTGREIVEFFLTRGPLVGLIAIIVATAIFSVVSAVTYEFARVFRTYDYRHFFKELLGPYWVLFEICFMVLMGIIGAVIGAAAGSVLQETFGLPYAVGVIGIMVAVALLVFNGSAMIERVLTVWSGVLYAVYITMFLWAFKEHGQAIRATVSAAQVGGGWFVSGVSYAGYNVILAPMVLFVVRHLDTRREAVIAGLLTGPIAMIPAALLYTALLGIYPGVLDRPVPVNFLLESLGSRGLQIAFQIMLFGTLVESGAGLIHAVNERIDGLARDRGATLPRWARPTVAIGFLLLSAMLAKVGLVGLIAKGYGTLTWAFVLLFVIPILTVGVWKIQRPQVEGKQGKGEEGRAGAP